MPLRAFESDEHLAYAAERGQEWAADELERRINAEAAAEIDSDDVFARLDFEGAKLPTPEVRIFALFKAQKYFDISAQFF